MSITTVIFDWGCVLSLPPGPAHFEPLRKPLGMHGIVFRSAEQLLPDLEPYRLAESWAEVKARAG